MNIHEKNFHDKKKEKPRKHQFNVIYKYKFIFDYI